MNPILMAIILVTVIGLIGAADPVAASIFMYVPVDERVEEDHRRPLRRQLRRPAAAPAVPTMPRASLRTEMPSTSVRPGRAQNSCGRHRGDHGCGGHCR